MTETKDMHRKLISQMQEAAGKVWFSLKSTNAEARTEAIYVLNDFIEAFERILEKETENDQV